MQIKSLVYLFIALLSAASVAAEDANVSTNRNISLDEAIHMALEHNLGLQIERYNPAIAQYTLSGSYAVYEPLVTLGADHSFNSSPGGVTSQGLQLPTREIESDNLSAGVSPGLQGYGPIGLRYGYTANLNNQTTSPPGFEQYTGGNALSAQLPLLRNSWIDSSRATILINKRNLKISEANLRSRILSTVASVEEAYYNLIFTRDNVKVQTKALEAASQLLRETKRRVEVGNKAPLDEYDVEAQVAASRADLLAALTSVTVQQNALKSLITDDFAKLSAINLLPVENLVAVPAELDLAESWRKGLTVRPDLQALKIDLEKRDITLKFQKNQLFPSLDLTGSYGGNGLNSSYGSVLDDLARNRNETYRYGVILSVPLGNSKARNDYKAGKAEKQQAILGYKQLEQRIMADIDNAVKLIQSDYERVEATKVARVFAEKALDAEQKLLESGKSTSYNVVDKQRLLTLRRFQEIQALADYNKAISSLRASEGSTLQLRNLEVKIK